MKKLPLHTKILIGFVLGIVFGIIANSLDQGAEFVETYMLWFGDAFIKLIRMIIVPLVFASILIGTASLNDVRKLGRIGSKTIIYYLCTTAIAITIGLLLANVIGPGRGFDTKLHDQFAQEYTKQQEQNTNQQEENNTKQEDTEQTNENIDQDEKNIQDKEKGTNLAAENTKEAMKSIDQAKDKPSVKDTLLDIITENPVKAMAEGKMLQIIFFALLFGMALTLIPPEKSKIVIQFFDGVNEAMLKLVHIIMHLAPFAVFVLISSTISSLGVKVLGSLFKFSFVVIAALLIHAVVIYPLALKIFTKMSIRKFFSSITDAQLFGFSASSSSATLPITMECAEENLGVSKEVSSFVLPLGATINMDGTAIFQAVATVFIAQIYGFDLGISGQLTIVITATLASIGTAGVPSVGIIMLIMVLESVGMTPEMITVGLSIIWGVNRILDMCRTAVNITGDASCAVIVAAGEGEELKNN